MLSFSIFGNPPKSPSIDQTFDSPSSPNRRKSLLVDSAGPQAHATKFDELLRDSPSPTSAQQQRNRSDSRTSRPMSMIQTYSPAMMDTGDTIPELQPIFSYLNAHSNKLYQEGYFLKLHDLDSRECIFAYMEVSVADCHRRTAQHRSHMDRVFCTACRHRTVIMGCSGVRRGRRRGRGASNIHQP